jgi:hypothetical protein
MAAGWEKDYSYASSGHYARVFWRDRDAGDEYASALYSLKSDPKLWWLRVGIKEPFRLTTQTDPPLEYAEAMYDLLTSGV